VKTESILFV